MNPEEPINPAEQVERIREILVGRDIHLVNQRIQELESTVHENSSQVAHQVSEQLHKTELQNKSAQEELQAITTHIRQQLQQESVTRGQQITDLAQKIDDAATRMDQTTQQLLNKEDGHTQDITKKIENLSSEMASRIDAHSRQIMEHMHREIQQWKTRMDGQISTLTENKVDRQELSSRFARIASAAMGDASLPASTVASSNYPTPPDQSPPFTSVEAPFAAPPIPSQPSQPSQPQSPPNLSSLDAFTMPTDDFTMPTDDFTT